MLDELQPSTERIRALVAEELADVGGAVSECFDDGRRLYLRAVLPAAREVRPRDAVRGGVAVMTVNEGLRVCPYVLRQVCRNGAILPRVIQVREIRRLPYFSAGVERELREAVQACTGPQVLSSAVAQMQSAAAEDATQILFLWPILFRLRKRFSERIFVHFERAGDRSAFGFMNAVTSVARDEPDPEARWRLEEFGGGILARLPRAPRSDGAELELVQS